MYPLSVTYTKKEIFWMMLYRCIFLGLFVFVLIPYDLWYPGNADQRISYFASTEKFYEFPISGGR